MKLGIMLLNTIEVFSILAQFKTVKTKFSISNLLFPGFVPGLRGAQSQAATLAELFENLQKVIRLCLLEKTDEEKAELPKFIGTQNISVAV